MTLVERYNNLKVRSIKSKAEIQQTFKSAKDLKIQYDQIVKDLTEAKDSYLIQESSINTMKEVVDKISQEHIDKVVDLLSYALQTIFYDKDYSVEVAMGDKRNSKTVEFYLVDRSGPKLIRSSFTDSIGGGILAVCGFVLQVYYLGTLKQANIMFCDESFSQVSSQYIDSLIAFIDELAKARGFIFVLISHDTRLIPHAKRTYEVVSGEVKLRGGAVNAVE